MGSGEGSVGRGDYRNYYNGHMDKINGEGEIGGSRWVLLGCGGVMGREVIQLLLNNNNNFKKNHKSTTRTKNGTVS